LTHTECRAGGATARAMLKACLVRSSSSPCSTFMLSSRSSCCRPGARRALPVTLAVHGIHQGLRVVAHHVGYRESRLRMQSLYLRACLLVAHPPRIERDPDHARLAQRA